MYKFGSIPPRSLQSFGVSGLLGEDAKVYYDNLFSTKALGRASDVFNALIQDRGIDELKLRSILMHLFFAALRKRSEFGLTDPLIMECGVDSEKVAIGISFPVKDAEGVKIEDYANVQAHTDHFVIRVDHTSSRVELVALVAIPSKIESVTPQSPTLIRMGRMMGDTGAADQVQEAPPAQQYIQIADVKYEELLREGAAANRQQAEQSSGRVLAQAVALNKVEPAASEARTSATIADNGNDANDAVVIRGVTQRIGDDEEIIVRGTPPSSPIDSDFNPAAEMPGGPEVSTGESHSDFASDSDSDTASASPGGFREILRKILPFWGNSEPTSEDHASPQLSKGPTVDGAPNDTSNEGLPAGAIGEFAQDPSKLPEGGDARQLAQMMMTEVQSGAISRALEGAQKQSKEMKKRVKDEVVREWIDGFMGDLIREKSKLQEVANKVAAAVRHKEFEIKNRDHAHAEALRMRDEVIHQKSSALMRVKEQLAQAHALIDKKKSSTGSSGEEIMLRRKLSASQRMLQIAKEENAKVLERIEELKEQLASVQNLQKNSEGPILAENNNLRSKNDRLTRQYTQMKMMNVQMLKRLKQATAGKANASNDELKKKLDSAMRIAAEKEIAVEMLTKKVETLTQMLEKKAA